MKKSIFAISMGVINFDASNGSQTNSNSLFTSIIRELAIGYLDMGAKMYLPCPVDTINSLDDILEAIGSSGCCVIEFESFMTLSNVSHKADQIVARHGVELMRPFLDIDSIDEEIRLVNNFTGCFRPYIVYSTHDKEFDMDGIIESMKGALSEKIQFGRNLSLDTKIPLQQLFTV